MPVLRVELDGLTIDVPVNLAMIPRIQNAVSLQDMPIANWDAMTKAERIKMTNDHEWLSTLLTHAKLKGWRYAELGAHRQAVGNLAGNKR